MSTPSLKDQNYYGILAGTVANSIFQGALFAFIFTLFGNPTWRLFLETSSLHFVLFPLAALSEVIIWVISTIDLATARNKNLSRVGKFIYDFLKMAMVVTAVVGSIVLAAVFASITPFLFIAVMGMGFAYNLGLAVWNVFKLYTTDNEDKKKILRENIKFHLISLGVTGIFVVALVFFMVIGVGAIVAGILGAISVAALVCATIYGAYKGIQALKAPTHPALKGKGIEIQTFEEDSETLLPLAKESPRNQEPETLLPIGKLAPPDRSLLGYFFSKNRSAEVIRLFYSENDGGVAAKNYLINEIVQKIQELEVKLLESPSEADKLNNKLTLLHEEKETIEADDKISAKEKIRQLCEGYYTRQALNEGAHQSFWRHKSDTADISEAVEDYLLLKEPRFLTVFHA